MGIKALDHVFVNHKSEEMICWTCGYVIWRCETPEEVEAAIVLISNGRKLACGGAWHKQIEIDAMKS